MLILNPERVAFGGEVWEGVRVVSIDRTAEREVVEWGDDGPSVVLADVAEERVSISVEVDVAGTDLGGVRPGDEGELVVFVSAAASDAGRVRVQVNGVVVGVRQMLGPGRSGGAIRRITLVAVASAGDVDPVVIEDASGGQM